MKIRVGNQKSIIELLPRNYLTAGGEASIYVQSGKAYKLYHDPTKKMLPIKKMQELAIINNSQVVIPQEVIYDVNNGNPLGYTTSFIDNAEPLLKFFTRTFKKDNNISFQMINELVKHIQLIVSDVHKSNCLIVDLNELNVLVKINPTILTPWFIDTDSYCTPSYKATAVMDSIRDRKCSVVDKNGILHYNPNVESDWFSWAVITFWLYTGIHPFRGSHPNYKPKDKQKEMDDGISIFHPGVRVPPSVNDFKVIPHRHLDWYKQVFLKNERGIPPLPDSSTPMLVSTKIVTIQGTDKLTVSEIEAYDTDIMYIHQFMGIYYVVTKNKIFAGKKEIGTNNSKRTMLCSANDGTLIVASKSGNQVSFNEINSSTPIGTINSSQDMFVRNGCVYTITNSKLVENSFVSFSGKVIHKIKEIENVSVQSATVYNGCVIQNLLGKKYLTLPYKMESCFSKHIAQLDGFRIVDAKSDKNITIVVAEKSGIYYRFVIAFDKKYTDFTVREVKDIVYDTINFCVMDNGLCLLLANDNEIELFFDNKKVDVIQNPPFDSTMKLFSTSDGIFFVNGNSFHQLKKK